jgi:hypothetical protein
MSPFCKQKTLPLTRPASRSVFCYVFSPLLLVMQQGQKPAGLPLSRPVQGRGSTVLRQQPAEVSSRQLLACRVDSSEGDRPATSGSGRLAEQPAAQEPEGGTQQMQQEGLSQGRQSQQLEPTLPVPEARTLHAQFTFARLPHHFDLPAPGVGQHHFPGIDFGLHWLARQ